MCMTILIGSKASAAGEVLVGHNEDAPGRFTMQTHLVHKKRRGSGKTRRFEPDTADIDLFTTRTNLFWSEAKNFSDAPSTSAFCDFYANGHGVVICSNNCANSREDSPELLNGGIGYGLRRLVAERAYTAREALSIACDLVDKYGYASSGRSYAFADKTEIYVMQIVHGKHYAIARVPDDEAAVIPNHYTIHEPDRKTRGYDELVAYAAKRGWYDPDDGAFDFAKAYQSPDSWGLSKNTYRHVKAFEILLDMDLSGLLEGEWQSLPFSIRPAHKVSIDTLKKILRSHGDNSNPHFSEPLTICNTETLESTIAEIRYSPDRVILRRALGRPCYSPYVVWYLGSGGIPEGYEDKNGEVSLTEHFRTKPEDMDYRNNAWFRTMEVQSCAEILRYDASERLKTAENKIEAKVKMLDPQIELRMSSNPVIARAMMEAVLLYGVKALGDSQQGMKNDMKIIAGEAVNSVMPGGNFSVRISKIEGLDVSECRCGPSYRKYSDWSECVGITEDGGYCVLEFSAGAGKWLDDAVPCFTDLYMLLTDTSGNRYAGSVKIKVRGV